MSQAHCILIGEPPLPPADVFEHPDIYNTEWMSASIPVEENSKAEVEALLENSDGSFMCGKIRETAAPPFLPEMPR